MNFLILNSLFVGFNIHWSIVRESYNRILNDDLISNLLKNRIEIHNQS